MIDPWSKHTLATLGATDPEPEDPGAYVEFIKKYDLTVEPTKKWKLKVWSATWKPHGPKSGDETKPLQPAAE